MCLVLQLETLEVGQEIGHRDQWGDEHYHVRKVQRELTQVSDVRADPRNIQGVNHVTHRCE